MNYITDFLCFDQSDEFEELGNDVKDDIILLLTWYIVHVFTTLMSSVRTIIRFGEALCSWMKIQKRQSKR